MLLSTMATSNGVKTWRRYGLYQVEPFRRRESSAGASDCYRKPRKWLNVNNLRWNRATVIASPTQEGEAIPCCHHKRSTRPSSLRARRRRAKQSRSTTANVQQHAPDSSSSTLSGLYTRGGLPAMGYDCVSPMVIHIEGFQPSFVANLRFSFTPWKGSWRR